MRRPKAVTACSGVLAVIACAGCASHPPPMHAHVGSHSHDGHGHAHGEAAMSAAAGAQPDHAHLHPASDPAAPCTCEQARLVNAWCRHCNVGYVAGHVIQSSMLFETVDPHGHDVSNPDLLERCADAIANDGWCDATSCGFVGGKAYFTRLTWGLARGRPMVASALECETCRAHSGEEPGWCGQCQRGMVGNVVFTDRALFDATAREFHTLLEAIEREKTCSMCAYAMLAHTHCPKCKLSYRLTAGIASPRERGF
jgi:hypothetical protein